MDGFYKKKLLLLAGVLVCFFLFLLVSEKSTANDHMYGPGNFYTGNFDPEADPREIYEQVYAGLAPGSKECRTEMQAAKGYVLFNGDEVVPVMAGNAVWIAPTPVKSSADVDLYKQSDSVLMPYRDGDVIISPGNLTFMNSNVVQEDPDTVYIEARYGSKYIIRWDDVECWWCHIGKESKRHSDVVGARGIYSKCIAGYVIGQAKSTTKVSFFEIDGDTTKETSYVNIFGSF